MSGLLCLALLLAASPAAPLNTDGFRLYQAKKYPEALEKFRAAVAADEQHALAQYNFAATLALLRGQGKVCEFDAYPGAILEHLEAAVRLDERRRQRMKVDRDFDSVRDTLRYQQLLGRSPASEKDARALLLALTWLAPATGAYGHPLTLKLSADGSLTLTRLVLTDDDVKHDVVKGRWKVKGFQVTLDFEHPVEGQKQAVGKLTAEGHLLFGLPAWDLSDQRSECDA